MNDIADDLVAIARHFNVLERDAICCGDVTVQQCCALQTLLGGAMTTSGLAEKLGASTSATTRLVDGLVRRDWVERMRDPDDRRRVLVELTSKGSEEAGRLRRMTCDEISRVEAEIPEERREQVRDSLRLLREALDRADDIGQSCC